MNTKILILCTGNTCRSQMAAGFLRHFDRDLHIRSAGTDPADEVNPYAIQAMEEIGIDISFSRPESVEKYIDEKWDYVITVCGHANEVCPTFTGRVRHRLHLGFDDPAQVTGTEKQIMKEFRRIREEIKVGLREFYEGLKYPSLQQY